MQWNVFLASAAGKHHLDGNLPCQDAGHYVVIGDVLVGAVCDGAGSASQGQAGSDFVARKVIELLADSVRSGRFDPLAQGDYRAQVQAMVQEARAQLAEIALARQLEIRDFACTLVGFIGVPGGGAFFHIGDGFGVCVRASGAPVLSQPENGEYSDETYFVSDDDWSAHLRVTPLPAIGAGGFIGLMSDGTSPFAINRTRTGFYRPFIDPVVNFLGNANGHDGSKALLGVLEDEKTWAITADDKTLLLALAS